MPHQSDQVFQSWHMPVVSPADVSELVSFGLYGFALSRYSGAWVGMTALSEVVESSATVDLDGIHAQTAVWKNPQEVKTLTGHQPPPDGLHYRWPDLPSLRIESRLQDKLAAVAAFAQVNSIDRNRKVFDYVGDDGETHEVTENWIRNYNEENDARFN
jgi:indolepyruvate ferredoxin oxidoreductase